MQTFNLIHITANKWAINKDTHAHLKNLNVQLADKFLSSNIVLFQNGVRQKAYCFDGNVYGSGVNSNIFALLNENGLRFEIVKTIRVANKGSSRQLVGYKLKILSAEINIETIPDVISVRHGNISFDKIIKLEQQLEQKNIVIKKLEKDLAILKKCPAEISDCAVCYTEIKNKVALVPCGHTKVCSNCIDRVGSCPMCRSYIDHVLPIF